MLVGDPIEPFPFLRSRQRIWLCVPTEVLGFGGQSRQFARICFFLAGTIREASVLPLRMGFTRCPSSPTLPGPAAGRQTAGVQVITRAPDKHHLDSVSADSSAMQ